MVALIKPQFEAGREKVGKKGVVREKSTHLEVIQMVMAYAAEIGFEIRNLEFPRSRDRREISSTSCTCINRSRHRRKL